MRPDPKFFVWFITGALYEYLTQGGDILNQKEFEAFRQDTITKCYSYLRKQVTSGSWSDIQCTIAINCHQMFGDKPWRRSELKTLIEISGIPDDKADALLEFWDKYK